MSLHTCTLEYGAWSVDVEVNCTHEGEREVHASHYDPGCPATGPEFDVVSVLMHGSAHSVAVPVSFVDDMGLEDAVRELLTEELEQSADGDAAEWAMDQLEQQEAMDNAE